MLCQRTSSRTTAFNGGVRELKSLFQRVISLLKDHTEYNRVVVEHRGGD